MEEMKMKLYRFMSIKEFDRMLAGSEIIGKKDFPWFLTTSRGICLTDDPQSIVDLEGIVSDGVCVEFECPNLSEAGVLESRGVYYSGMKTEYCIASYNNSVLKPLRYAPSTNPILGGRKNQFITSDLEWDGYQPVEFDWYDIFPSEIVPPDDAM